MDRSDQTKTLALGLVGAVAGGVVGYFITLWIYRQGFYAPVIPAALLGFGASVVARRSSTLLATLCGIAGLALGFFVEWHFFPFGADRSPMYFLKNIHHVQPISLVLIALGAYLAYRFALGWDQRSV